MKPVDVKWNTYIGLNVEKNDKDPKLKVGDHARTSKHRSTIAKELKKQSREKMINYTSNGKTVIIYLIVG